MKTFAITITSSSLLGALIALSPLPVPPRHRPVGCRTTAPPSCQTTRPSSVAARAMDAQTRSDGAPSDPTLRHIGAHRAAAGWLTAGIGRRP